MSIRTDCLFIVLLAVLVPTFVAAQDELEPKKTVTLEQMLPIEGIMSFLSFEERIPDDQLLASRLVLEKIYLKRKAYEIRLKQGLPAWLVVQGVEETRQDLVKGLSQVLDEELATKIRTTLDIVVGKEEGDGGDQADDWDDEGRADTTKVDSVGTADDGGEGDGQADDGEMDDQETDNEGRDDEEGGDSED